MSNMAAPVLGINRLRINVDGVGLRTLICMYGCPLRCQYCLNPHSWDLSHKPQFLTPEELYDKVKLDNLYFQTSSGGITFGGGEPLLHSNFINEFKKLCPPEWNFNIETSLNVPINNLMDIVNIFDTFTIDIKTINPDIYKKYTGVNNATVIENLKYLLDTISAEQVIVRVPNIPAYTTPNDIEESISYLRSVGVTQIRPFDYVIKNNMT